MKPILVWLLLALSVLAGANSAAAADFPSRPIKFIVPFTPGTGMDSIARQVGEKISQKFGQPVVVENRTGVSGHIGAELAARAPADGHTLLVTARNISITALLYPSTTFDASKDLIPVAIAAWGGTTLVANTKTKFNTLREMLAQAKVAPGKVAFASAGVGSPSHISLELFQVATGTEFLHVPYKGTGPAITDLIAGHVEVALLATHTIMPFVARGQLKAIAVAAQKRHRLAPGVPALSEEGVTNFSDDTAWYGFLAPAGTPPEIVTKWNSEIRSILTSVEVKASLEKIGLDVRPSTVEEMRAVLVRERAEIAEIIKKNNIKGE
jgi:tripartite-type tricarboxylate transporter receptor subunit TctC